MKILIVGSGPLPDEKRGIANAGGLRTQQFLEGITERHDVSLIVIENEEYKGIKHISEETLFQKNVSSSKRYFRHIAVSKYLGNVRKTIKKELKQFSPDVVIGVNTFPSFLLAQVILKQIPFWADLNGWVMAEVQAQAHSMQSNAFLSYGYKMEQTILSRADKVSVVSTPQKFACIGEIASMGRLSKDNFLYKHVEVVENACMPLSIRKEQQKKEFRGNIFPERAVAVLWLGGFNAWADEETLFYGLEKAMKKNKDIHFICTGGILPGIDEKKYPHLQEMIQKSEHASRFHLLGWVDGEKIPALLWECDMGINVDILCAETETGARNRINEMLRFGLPIISSRGTEIAHILETHSAGVICESGNTEEIERAVLMLAGSEEKRKEIKKEEETLIKTRFSATITQKPLITWLNSPKRTPDAGNAVPIRQKRNIFLSGILYCRQRGIVSFLRKCHQTVFEKLGL